MPKLMKTDNPNVLMFEPGFVTFDDMVTRIETKEETDFNNILRNNKEYYAERREIAEKIANIIFKELNFSEELKFTDKWQVQNFKKADMVDLKDDINTMIGYSYSNPDEEGYYTSAIASFYEFDVKGSYIDYLFHVFEREKGYYNSETDKIISNMTNITFYPDELLENHLRTFGIANIHIVGKIAYSGTANDAIQNSSWFHVRFMDVREFKTEFSNYYDEEKEAELVYDSNNT